MDANVCDKDHNPTNCYLTVTTRIVLDRAVEENAGHRSDICPAACSADLARPRRRGDRVTRPFAKNWREQQKRVPRPARKERGLTRQQHRQEVRHWSPSCKSSFNHSRLIRYCHRMGATHDRERESEGDQASGGRVGRPLFSSGSHAHDALRSRSGALSR